MTSRICRPLVAALVAFACVLAPAQSQTQTTTYTTNDDVYLVIDAGVIASIEAALNNFMAYLQNTGVRVGALIYSDSVNSAFDFTSDRNQFASLIRGLVETAASRVNTGAQRDLAGAIRVMNSQVNAYSQFGRSRKGVIITNRTVQYSDQLRSVLSGAMVTSQIDVSAIFVNGNQAEMNDFINVMRSMNVTVRTASLPSDVRNRLEELFLRQSSACRQCEVKSGLGFASHPNSCDRFITCMVDIDGNIISYDRSCPPGSLWDQTQLTCKHFEEYQGGCPSWCANTVSQERYATEASTAYWECEAGRPRYRACNQTMSYNRIERRCLPDPNLARATTCIQDNFRLLPDKPCGFAVRDVQRDTPWTETMCAEGLRFNMQTCMCDIPDKVRCMRPVATQLPVARELPGGQCMPDFCLTFDQNARVGATSSYKYQPWVDDANDDIASSKSAVLVTSGTAQFDGRQSGNRLRVPFYTNAEFSAPTVFVISFMEGSQANADMVLMTNGDCSIQPSVYIQYNPAQRRITLGVRLVNSERYLTTSANLQPQWASQWKTVKMVYNGESLSGEVYIRDNRNQREVIPPVAAEQGGLLSGKKIRASQYPLQFGYQSTGEPYVGQMDNICVYRECVNTDSV